jgi:hypothetical protein
MAMLGRDRTVVMGHSFPFEDRYLTYLAKRELLLERPEFVGGLNGDQLCDYEDIHFGGYPWLATPARSADPAPIFPSTAAERVNALWHMFSAKARRASFDARLYAEKAPPWLPGFLRAGVPTQTLYLFRDPRDVFLSVNAFRRWQNDESLGGAAETLSLDRARNLAYEYLLYYENYRADRARNDCHLVRYAELVREPVRLADRLGRLLAIDVSEAGEHRPEFESHRTTATLADSLDRWRREPPPPPIVELLETPLAEAMAALGYPTSAPASMWPAVEFPRQQEKPSGLAHGSDGAPEPAGENGLRVRLAGDDFWLVLPLEAFEAAGVREVWVSLWGPAGNHCSLFWSPPGGNFAEERCLHQRYHPCGHWQVLRFRVGQHPLWQGTIGRLRLDPFNGPPGPIAGPQFVRWVRAVR